MSETPLLEVDSLGIRFELDTGDTTAIDGVSFQLAPGEALAIVGESGSGKSVTSLAIMGLLPERARIVSGSIRFRGDELLTLDARRRRALGGTELAMVYQDALAALNPSLTIGQQIGRVVRHHTRASRAAARARAIELLELVELPDASRRVDDYPHQLSGGQRQRVLIALALACEPALLIADEPTTALDVTVQAQILDLVSRLRRELGMAVIWVSHDLGVVAEVVDRVVVMYAGRIVESSPVDELFARPAHPYTAGLFASLPSLDRTEPLRPIPGAAPELSEPDPGCTFRDRCAYRTAECEGRVPRALPVRGAPDHRVACVHPLVPTAAAEVSA